MASTLASGQFWAAAAERAVKTLAQTLAALLVATDTDVLSTAWSSRLSVALMAAIVSLLTSVASDAATGSGPSLTDAEVLPEAPRGGDGPPTYTPRHAA